jgi:hypothetical protein
MNDRELLEAAAKSAGIELCWFEVGEGDPDCDPGWYCTNVTAGGMWNPLTDDGDALRLAVKLRLDFYEGDDDGKAAYVGYYEPNGNTRPQRFMVEWHDAHPDPCAAARRAIVRAAAAMCPREPHNV